MLDKVDEIAPCTFSRRRYSKKEEVTVSRKYSKITFSVDKVSQTHASLLDTIAISCKGQDLASACSMNKWQCYKPPLKSRRSSATKQLVVSEAVAQADKNDHQENECKDIKNIKLRQRLQSLCRSRHQEHWPSRAMRRTRRWPWVLVLTTRMITS